MDMAWHECDDALLILNTQTDYDGDGADESGIQQIWKGWNNLRGKMCLLLLQKRILFRKGRGKRNTILTNEIYCIVNGKWVISRFPFPLFIKSTHFFTFLFLKMSSSAHSPVPSCHSNEYLLGASVAKEVGCFRPNPFKVGTFLPFSSPTAFASLPGPPWLKDAK